ncbi:uncharacterized protein LOC119884485 isoform X2 [Micropterus salmoides]|uniref:uncharacterized protein LOC119884485 isoform X2 n=1 Tax=Micropterus salmoides TaxID=27706 RepID=UPI0018EB20E9|nr:uncharacterized protein LOC119884485 isoform X2 [Micropterus salmoides]
MQRENIEQRGDNRIREKTQEENTIKQKKKIQKREISSPFKVLCFTWSVKDARLSVVGHQQLSGRNHVVLDSHGTELLSCSIKLFTLVFCVHRLPVLKESHWKVLVENLSVSPGSSCHRHFIPVIYLMVSKQQQPYKNIKTASKCKLIKAESYTLLCPQAKEIQPTEEDFDLDFGPNYHPTFEIFLPTDKQEVTLTLQDQRNMEVWKRKVVVTDPALREENPARPQSGSPRSRLASVRSQFVDSVSEPVLNQLLDRLLQRDIINQEEMDSARSRTRADRARAVIDMVRNKGTEASSALIEDFRMLDPHCSRNLNLS